MHYVRLDITDDSSVKHFAATLEAEYGGVTVLVNNAGLSLHSKQVIFTSNCLLSSIQLPVVIQGLHIKAMCLGLMKQPKLLV